MSASCVNAESRHRCGVVVIGRNEGDNLERALTSIASEDRATVVYVDSGSIDGSVDLARSMGVKVHELDCRKPFSAARARREGLEVLLDACPGIEYVQFLDGDCEMAQGWLEGAVGHLDGYEDVAVVCGALAEKHPQASVYNRMSALQWEAATGDIEACGGIFMIRLSAYRTAGGFDDRLLTGEEEELCRRVRRAGHRIVRINRPMAVHDSGLTRFSQWWARAVWGGFGDAIKFTTAPSETWTGRLVQLHKRCFWPVVVPLTALCGGIGTLWSAWCVVIPIACLAAYGALFVKMAFYRLRLGDAASDAMLYASLMIVRKVPNAIGFLGYFVHGSDGARRPDPHAATRPVGVIGQEAPARGRPE